MTVRLRPVQSANEEVDGANWDLIARLNEIRFGTLGGVVDAEHLAPASGDSPISRRAVARTSTPVSAGPTVGANCHGKVTEDVRRVGLIRGPLLRGEFEERVYIDMGLGDLPRFGP